LATQRTCSSGGQRIVVGDPAHLLLGLLLLGDVARDHNGALAVGPIDRRDDDVPPFRAALAGAVRHREADHLAGPCPSQRPLGHVGGPGSEEIDPARADQRRRRVDLGGLRPERIDEQDAALAVEQLDAVGAGVQDRAGDRLALLQRRLRRHALVDVGAGAQPAVDGAVRVAPG
jgi:hypothetical protein